MLQCKTTPHFSFCKTPCWTGEAGLCQTLKRGPGMKGSPSFVVLERASRASVGPRAAEVAQLLNRLPERIEPIIFVALEHVSISCLEPNMEVWQTPLFEPRMRVCQTPFFKPKTGVWQTRLFVPSTSHTGS